MTNPSSQRLSLHSWRTSILAMLKPKVVMMLFMGFSSGLPLLLIFSSLSLWLREAGIERSAVTYFSWAALGYSFKFVWAPLVDRVPLPGLSHLLGQRRAWLFSAQLVVMASIVAMAMINPAAADTQLSWMAIAAVCLGFSAATQDIVIDAYRIESAETELQALMSSSYIAGYRIGMLASGAGALFLASGFGSEMGTYSYQAWQLTYLCMAACMLVGLITTLCVHEPELKRDDNCFSQRDYLSLIAVFLMAVIGFVGVFMLSSDIATTLKAGLTDWVHNKHLAGAVVEALRLFLGAGAAFAVFSAVGGLRQPLVVVSYVDPVKEFFTHHGAKTALLLLALICLYRISDIVLGVISNVFYQDLGFTKTQIGAVVKSFGLAMTILGGFLGGVLIMRFGVMRVLWWGAMLTVLTNILFIALAQMGQHLPMLYVVISADNLAAGLASAAFVAFLSGLVDVRFTAMQYAIFSSLMTLIPKIIGGYSGSIVDAIGYGWFFAFAAALGVPVLFLIHRATDLLAEEAKREEAAAET